MKSKDNIIKNAITLILVLLFALSSLFLVKGWLDGHFASFETLKAYICSFGISGPLILTLIQALQVVLPVLPGFLGCLVGAAMFGSFGGFWINYIGISAGSLLAFWLARKYGVSLVRKMIPMEKYARFTQWINTRKSFPLVLFLSILLPLAPDDFLCYFSGLASFPAKKFIGIILLGKPWCILFYSLFFAYLL